MKLSCYAVTAALTLAANKRYVEVNAFSPAATASSSSKKSPSISQNAVKLQYNNYNAADRSSQQMSMAIETQYETSAASMDFEDIRKLPYRQLQKYCKDRGLPANGSTAALRTRLLEDLGLVVTRDEECDISGEGTDEEVSGSYVVVITSFIATFEEYLL